MSSAAPAISLCLLFLLVAGISASVDTSIFKSRFKATKGILVGVSCQFLLLPLLGVAAVRVFNLPDVFGIPLIATTCSPGGAYSNWWCSVFNADLALSVAMTACSTVLSVICMPVNLFLYVKATYGHSVVLDWWRLVLSLVVALLAITCGLLAGYTLPRYRSHFNVAGNLAGIALIAFGALTSSRDDPLWDKDASFYAAVSLPCLVGLALAFALSWCCGLDGPQRVAVTVETSYQNTSIALTLVLATFPKKDQSAAAGVPLFYGVVEVLLLPLFLFTAWRLNLTYAPVSDRFLKVLTCSYQPQSPVDANNTGKEDTLPPELQLPTVVGDPADLVFDESNGQVFSV